MHMHIVRKRRIFKVRKLLNVLIFPFFIFFLFCCPAKLFFNCTYVRLYMYTDVIVVTALPSILCLHYIQCITLKLECQGEYSYRSVLSSKYIQCTYKSAKEKLKKQPHGKKLYHWVVCSAASALPSSFFLFFFHIFWFIV